jgi:glyoxylase-like metal-dependent hydrolase (beta-lactamase superfamily II)
MLLRKDGAVGKVEIARVLDSYLLAESAQVWLPEFDREAVRSHEHWLCPTHYDPESGRIPMPVHSFILRTQHHNVLIDTCIGNDKERPGLGEFHHLTTRYLDRLAAVGLRPEDIDYVLCTHLHIDHIGWNTRLVDGRWVPTFPNARYVMSKVEFETTRADADKVPIPALRNCFYDSVLPVVEAGKVEFVEGVHQFLDELVLRPAPGHSPGHIRIELRSDRELAVFAGDMVHSPIQVPFWQWSSRVCWDQKMAAQARRELLEFCVAENALLVPGHFEAPHVARVREDHGTFALKFGW